MTCSIQKTRTWDEVAQKWKITVITFCSAPGGMGASRSIKTYYEGEETFKALRF
jgi:hypothetical protein